VVDESRRTRKKMRAMFLDLLSLIKEFKIKQFMIKNFVI